MCGREQARVLHVCAHLGKVEGGARSDNTNETGVSRTSLGRRQMSQRAMTTAGFSVSPPKGLLFARICLRRTWNSWSTAPWVEPGDKQGLAVGGANHRVRFWRKPSPAQGPSEGTAPREMPGQHVPWRPLSPVEPPKRSQWEAPQVGGHGRKERGKGGFPDFDLTSTRLGFLSMTSPGASSLPYLDSLRDSSHCLVA